MLKYKKLAAWLLAAAVLIAGAVGYQQVYHPFWVISAAEAEAITANMNYLLLNLYQCSAALESGRSL